MTARVYRYGLLPPTLGAERVAEQIQLAHRYYNRLIEIERARRAEVRPAKASKWGKRGRHGGAARGTVVDAAGS